VAAGLSERKRIGHVRQDLGLLPRHNNNIDQRGRLADVAMKKKPEWSEQWMETLF
jgi:hypothetical protein